MSESSSSESLVGPEVVVETELDELVKRRRAAGFALPEDSDKARQEVAQTTVGLALSGGGIRSACFNLGLLQAMFRKGLLRQVDYLSTVSGGGYVGSYLSSLALRCRGSHIFAANDPEEHAQAPDAESIEEVRQSALNSDEHERYTARRLRFLRGGTYLAKPLRFINRWLIGVFLINVVFFSAMVSVVTALALLFRMLDLHRPMIWIGALGFEDDIRRALFPSFLLFAAWLIAWGVSYWRSGPRASGLVARFLAVLLITSLLLAVAVLIGTGDIALVQLTKYAGFDPDPETVKMIKTGVGVMFAGLVLVGLLPFFRPDLLIRSGLKPHNPVERVIFWFAARALLVGFPLVMFAILARENISGYNKDRTHLDPADIKDTRGFWQAVQQASTDQEDGENRPLAQMIWIAAENYKQQAEPHSGDTMDAYLFERPELDRERAKAIDATLPHWQRWLLLFDCWHGYHSNKVRELADLRLNAMQRRKGIFKQVSDEVLARADFWTFVADDAMAMRQPFLKPSDGAENTEGGQASEQAKSGQNLIRRAKSLQSLLAVQRDGSPGQEEWRQELLRTNRELFKVYFQPLTREQTPVYANVVAWEDQKARAGILLGALALFLISAALVNMNDTSMHGFYRNQLAEMWIEEVPGMGRVIPLARLETTAKGAPYHLVSATINSLGRRSAGTELRQRHFLFSHRYCGSAQTGYRKTDDYMAGEYDLGNAMALSGAAISPVQFTNPLVSVMLLLLNFRLGQWLSNPASSQSPASVTPLRLLCNIFRRRQRYCFLTDGGHYENLGIEQLLKRRCRLIIASDATCDPKYSFPDLISLHRRARVEDGIRFYSLDGQTDLSPSALRPSDDPPHDSSQHFFAARIAYPGGVDAEGKPQIEWGLLIYIKPSFTGDEGIEMAHHREKHEAYPHDTTANQLYTEEKFEAYNQLGNHIGEALCRGISPSDSEEAFEFDLIAETLVAACAAVADAQPAMLTEQRSSSGEGDEDDVRVSISRLPNSSSPEAIAVLIRALASKHEEVRAVATKLLLDVDTNESANRNALLSGMEEDQPAIRARVARILRDLDPLPAEAKTVLEQHRRDADKAVRAAVQRALEKIAERAQAKSQKSTGKRSSKQGAASPR